MTDRTHPGRSPLLRDSDVPGSLGSWKAHEAMAESAGRHRLGLAEALGVSRSLVDKWCSEWGDHHDSGARGPLDRLGLGADAGGVG